MTMSTTTTMMATRIYIVVDDGDIVTIINNDDGNDDDDDDDEDDDEDEERVYRHLFYRETLVTLTVRCPPRVSPLMICASICARWRWPWRDAAMPMRCRARAVEHSGPQPEWHSLERFTGTEIERSPIECTRAQPCGGRRRLWTWWSIGGCTQHCPLSRRLKK